MRFAVHVLAAALVCAASAAAHAAGPRLVLDRVDVQPSWLDGYARLRLFVTAVKLEGSVIPVRGEDAWTVRLSGSLVRERPLLGRFGGTEEELAIVFALERGFDYEEDLPRITRAAGRFLEKLPDRARVAILDYGEDVAGGHRLRPPGAAARELEGLLADPAPAEPRLIDALERAVRTLRRAEPEVEGAPLRRLIVLVSDGRDIDPSPDRYRDLGELARRHDIRIHPLAYSPVDNRRPLLGLGELAKRSGGTFRWVRSREGFGAQLRTLQDEIEGQYVLTYLLPEERVAEKRVRVEYGDLASEDVRARALACGEESCAAGEMCVRHQCRPRPRLEGAGLLGWVLYLVGGLAGLLLVLLLIGFFLHRRQEKRAARSRAALAGAEPSAAGSHRIAGVAPGGVAAPSARAAPTAAAAPGLQPALYVVKGPGEGSRIPLAHGMLLGTANSCHIRLSGDTFASSHHAQILMDTAGGCSIVDKGSTNGTFVNGVRTAEMRLKHGMLIRVGSSELRFLER